jgi:hypothetical protein
MATALFEQNVTVPISLSRKRLLLSYRDICHSVGPTRIDVAFSCPQFGLR